jgi:hypothetical protein
MIPMLEQFLKKYDEKLKSNDKVAVKWTIFVANRKLIFVCSVLLFAALYLTDQFHVFIACSGIVSAALIFLCYFFMLNDNLNGGLVFAVLTALSAGCTVMLEPRISLPVLMLNGLGGIFLTIS